MRSDRCRDGRDGLFLASEGIFDLIDRRPDAAGARRLAMVSAIRAAGIATPVAGPVGARHGR